MVSIETINKSGTAADEEVSGAEVSKRPKKKRKDRLNKRAKKTVQRRRALPKLDDGKKVSHGLHPVPKTPS
jgi:hypothetical protein